MIKKILLITLIPIFGFTQSKNISFNKKITEPYITSVGDTLKVNDEIYIKEGTVPDGSFKYIQLLNYFNEPIQPAESKSAFQKQKIKFFKEQNGAYYMFTKFYVINIEGSIIKGEVEIVKNKKK